MELSNQPISVFDFEYKHPNSEYKHPELQFERYE